MKSLNTKKLLVGLIGLALLIGVAMATTTSDECLGGCNSLEITIPANDTLILKLSNVSYLYYTNNATEYNATIHEITPISCSSNSNYMPSITYGGETYTINQEECWWVNSFTNDNITKQWLIHYPSLSQHPESFDGDYWDDNQWKSTPWVRAYEQNMTGLSDYFILGTIYESVPILIGYWDLPTVYIDAQPECLDNVTNLTAQVSNLNGIIVTLETELSECQDNLTEYKDNLTSCQSSLTTCENDTISYNETVSNYDICSSDLATCTSDLSSSGINLDKCLTDLQTKTNSYDAVKLELDAFNTNSTPNCQICNTTSNSTVSVVGNETNYTSPTTGLLTLEQANALCIPPGQWDWFEYALLLVSMVGIAYILIEETGIFNRDEDDEVYDDGEEEYEN